MKRLNTMKLALSALCVVLCTGAAFAAVSKPRVIIDTDLGSSMDDLFTVDLAARMHREGKLELMGVMMNRPDHSDEGKSGEFLAFADRYLASLGFGDLPLGKAMPLAEDRIPQQVFNPYWTLIYSNNLNGVGALMPTNRTATQLAERPNAVKLYRRLLEDAPLKSVVICSAGFLNNLKALMESGINYEGDDIYFTGLELITAKVKELRIMGGCFDPAVAPEETDGAEYNVAGDPVAAKKVFEQWPSPVVVSPWEVGLKLEYLPNDVLADFPVGTFDSVVRAAYTYWREPPGDYMNRLWDPMTVLPLVEGETLVPLSEMGGILVDTNGVTTFTLDATSNRCYQVASNMNATAVMNRFRAICQAGNPSVSLLVSGQPEPGVDYNGSELVFKFEDIQLGVFSEEDLKFGFVIDNAEYAPESTEWDETLGVLSVRFAIPPDAVTAGNVYNGMLTVTLENETLGMNVLATASRQLVQGVLEGEDVNANLAEVNGMEYATVTEAVAEANGNPIRLLHAASWKPTAADVGRPVKFLNKGDLILDLSDFPANARTVWTDVDGNNGTLTVKLVYADKVVYGTIRTAEAANPVAEAIAIGDGKYVYVGDEADAAAFIEDGVTEVVDHRGKGMVMPGCTDGHAHYANTFAMGSMKGGILFDAYDDKDAVLQKLSEATRKASDVGKKSLCGFGWSYAILNYDRPNLQELDIATHGVSTVIFDSSGHHAFCNSECLKRCGIIDGKGKALIKEIDGGLLELDENKYPTGYVNERVTGYLTRMGGINADELIDDEVAEDAIRKTQELLLSTGYTMTLDAWSNNLHPSKFYEVAKRLDDQHELKLVYPMTYEVEPWQTNMTEQIDYLASLKGTYGTSHVLPEYLKVFMDGVVETGTGATIAPYQKDGEDDFVYKSFWSADRLADITAACNARGLTVHTHTMGDAAIKETVDAYVKANGLRNDNAFRNCLVHLRNVRKEDFQRIADNNIACAAGLTWHATDMDFDNILKRFLRDEYVKHAYPIKSFLDAGIRASGHSDYPANIPSPQDPFGMMQVAVTGMVPDPGERDYPYDTNELISVEQAFQMLTLNGAWQFGLENERGSIAVGKWADFVLADQDVFDCAVTNICKTKVVSTWFEGEKVYSMVETVPVKPGESIVRDTAEEASNILKRAEFTTSAEVAERLGGEGSTALQTYRNMFALDVVPFGDSQWAVEAFLLPMDWTNVALSAQAATLQIPLAAIAALGPGDDPIPVQLTNCVPGFYYSLYDGSEVANVTLDADNRDIICGREGTVTFPAVKKPSDTAGFFSIGVMSAPGIMPTDRTIVVPGLVKIRPMEH